jgi:hypothetical protein
LNARSICLLGLVTIAGFGAVAQRAPAGEPPSSPPVPSPYDAARTAAERAANEAAYREHVAPIRESLVHEHLGHWVVIAGGRVFPLNEHGTMVRPAATREEADAAARLAVPDAQHRFVFRIGEEGDVSQDVGGTEHAHVLGVRFIALLERRDVEMRGLGPRQPIHFFKDGQRTEITAKGPDDRMYLRPEVGPVGHVGAFSKRPLFVLSTGSTGYATVAAETAAAGRLHLFEIPGKVVIEGTLQSGEGRRARARLQFAGTDLDFVVPVAIWKEKP